MVIQGSERTPNRTPGGPDGWLAGHRDPQDLRQCGPVVVKTRSGGPATSYQQSGDWSLQDSSPADSRTGGLEDWYLSRLEDWKDLTLNTGL